jgi:hypothetical protein
MARRKKKYKVLIPVFFDPNQEAPAWIRTGVIFKPTSKKFDGWVFEHRHDGSNVNFIHQAPKNYDIFLIGLLIQHDIRNLIDVRNDPFGGVLERAIDLDRFLRFSTYEASGGRQRFFCPFFHWSIVKLDYRPPGARLTSLKLYSHLADLVRPYLMEKGLSVSGFYEHKRTWDVKEKVRAVE